MVSLCHMCNIHTTVMVLDLKDSMVNRNKVVCNIITQGRVDTTGLFYFRVDSQFLRMQSDQPRTQRERGQKKKQ